MTDDEKRLMELHGITEETRKIYRYRDEKYDRLHDALNYAEKVEGREKSASPAKQKS